METQKECVERVLLGKDFKRPDTFTIKNQETDYLEGFIRQFKEELNNEDWTVSRWLDWLRLNNFKIIK